MINSTRIWLRYAILPICLFALNGRLNAQEASTPAIVVPNHAVSLGLMGAIPIGLSVDYTLSTQFSLEVSLGSGYSGGLKYYITNPSKHRFNCFTGAFYTTTEFSMYTDSSGVRL